jgi:hypothetical protein
MTERMYVSSHSYYDVPLTVPQILQFLDKTAENPLHYGVEEDEVKASGPAIKQAVGNIRKLTFVPRFCQKPHH